MVRSVERIDEGVKGANGRKERKKTANRSFFPRERRFRYSSCPDALSYLVGS